MNVAKNGIRVIKREERERLLQQEREPPAQDSAAAREPLKDKSRECASTVAGWVQEFLRQQHPGLQEDI